MNLSSKLQKYLLEAGLSEAEVVLYVELMKKPAESTWTLVERTGMAKSTVYRALDRLVYLNLVERGNGGVKALSLKSLVAELEKQHRNLRKTALKIRELAPFLRVPFDSVDKFESYFTIDQVKDAYMYMADLKYGVNFDFGDFEAYIPLIGGYDTGMNFRKLRSEHAKNHSVCTTFGPNTAAFCNKNDQDKFAAKVELLDMDFKNRFVVFSDSDDHVMFNEVDDDGNVKATLVRSKMIADIQRKQFASLSRKLGN